jgi:hypothetical protein
MRLAATSFVLVAILGCKKANDAGSGTAASGSVGTGSATTGSSGSSQGSSTGSTGGAGGSMTGSAAASDDFTDKLDLPKQPDRTREEQAYVDNAANALRALLTKAKTAKDATEFCKTFTSLGKQVADLNKLKAPAGVDPQAFADQRDKMMNKVTASHPGYCDEPASASLDQLRDVVSDIRDDFIALVGMGAK